MKLPEHFEKRRDELGPQYTGSTCSSTEVSAYRKGYNAAYADLMAEVQPLIEALEHCKSAHYDNRGFARTGNNTASKALADWQKKFAGSDGTIK